MDTTENVELAHKRPTAAGGGTRVVHHHEPAKKHSDSHVGQSATTDLEFVLVASVFQTILLILYAISSDYETGVEKQNSHDEEWGIEPGVFYSMYMDVHSMMFVGFGFLMTFLRRYGFG